MATPAQLGCEIIFIIIQPRVIIRLASPQTTRGFVRSDPRRLVVMVNDMRQLTIAQRDFGLLALQELADLPADRLRSFSHRNHAEPASRL